MIYSLQKAYAAVLSNFKDCGLDVNGFRSEDGT